MPTYTALDTPQARHVRVPAPQGAHSRTVIWLHTGCTGGTGIWQGSGSSAEAHHHTARQDAALRLICRAVRSTDLVCELADGSMACLLTGALGRERLSLLSWFLLDALARLAQGPPAPTLRPGQAHGSAWHGACIGICTGPAAGRGYATMAQHARTAMHRARQQQSGFAFFDDACV